MQKIVLIVSDSRSGSTLLDLLIGKLKNAIAVGELHLIWQRGVMEQQLCGCGTKLPSCNFWSKVFGELNIDNLTCFATERVKNLKKVDGMQSLKIRNFIVLVFLNVIGFVPRYIQEYVRKEKTLFDAISKVSNKSLIVDSSKSSGRVVALSMSPELRKQLYVIHLVRDCRGVVYSRSKKKRRPEITDRVEYFNRPGAIWASVAWTLKNVAASLLKFIVPDGRYFFLRYEDLAANVDDSMLKVSEFLGCCEDNDIGNVLINESEKVEHTVSGNPMRFNDISNISVDEAWKTEMKLIPKTISTIFNLPFLVFSKFGSSPKVGKRHKI